MYTPVEVHFSDACWRLLHDETLPTPLGPELRAILDLSPRVRVVMPDPSPRYVVAMLRMHAHELVTFVGAAAAALPVDDPKRRECQTCLDDLDNGIVISASR